MTSCRALWSVVVLAVATVLCFAAESPNLCPNPGAEEGAGGQITGWTIEGSPGGQWADDQAHSGRHSLKITTDQTGPTRSWLSPIIPVPPGGQELILSVWVKLAAVTGANGAFMCLYHMDGNGARIGQSAEQGLGGASGEVATNDWQEAVAISSLRPEVKGVRVNVRLYGAKGTAWFDDFSLRTVSVEPLRQVRPLRPGLRVATPGTLAIVSARDADDLAQQLRQAFAAAGRTVPVVGDTEVNLATEPRDLIILGNLATSRAAEYLYLRSYSLEDLNFPGAGGYVLRPLVDPLGTGSNLLVVGASDRAGLTAGVQALGAQIKPPAATLQVPLTVKSSGYRSVGGGWLEAGAIAYLFTGNMAAARTYRETMLSLAATPDAQLFNPDNTLHLWLIRRTLSWDLMDSCGVFSDEERLLITNYLLKIMRSAEGARSSLLRAGMYSRENHGTRAARAVYYGWRHFNKYYREPLGGELGLWRRALQGFWAPCFASSRSFEDSLSQHALGGSYDNTLDIAFQEPEWSRDFFASGRARRMGERCLVISNNMGQTVLLGDTAAGDYASTVFSKLGYFLRDGRYLYMLNKRGFSASSDESLRAFDVGVKPQIPTDAQGLKVVPPDDLYWRTALTNTAGVPFERGFDKLALRSGFDPQDEYLMLDGVAGGSHSYDDANTIGEFSAHGRRWLCEIDIFNGPTLAFHNAVTVARDGLGDPSVPQAAELVDSLNAPGLAYTATRLPRYNGTTWTRHLLWLPGQYTFCLDELTATSAGDYSFVLGWRSLGEPTLKPGQFESAQDDRPRVAGVFTGQALVDAISGTSGKAARLLGDYDALFYRADTVGDYIEVKLPAPAKGEYELQLDWLKYVGRGTFQLSLDGKPLGEPADLFVSGPPAHGAVSLGRVQLTPGPHLFRFTLTGKHPASDAYTFGLCSLALRKPGEKPMQTLSPNRFRLAFPADVPTALERDSEVLGPYLPPSKDYEPVLNILEQSRSSVLQAGETICFQNVFGATAGTRLRALELRRLSEQCALVKCGEEITLVGLGSAPVNFASGALRARGRVFALSPTRVILRDATASLSGKALAADRKPPAALAALLKTCWDNAEGPAAAARPTQQTWPALAAAWHADLPDRPLSVLAYRADAGMRVAVGQTNGTVSRFDATGQAAGQFTTGGPVHALCAANLDGQDGQELLVGSDDEHVSALRTDLSVLWQAQVPFLREEQIWMWWTLGSSKVRRIHADDLNGDGRPEVLLGVGNMRLHCLDAAGRELWRFRTDHGICTTLTSADVFGEGKQRVLAGNGLTSDQGACWVLDERGKLLQSYFNGGWCTALPAIAVGGPGPDGRRTVYCGNNRGDVRAYPAAQGSGVQPLWLRNMTRPVRSLTVVPSAAGELLAVGADSGYLCAFNRAGDKAWGRPLSSGILRTALVSVGGRPRYLAAGCKDGQVFLTALDGAPTGQYHCGGRLEDLTVTDLDGDGRQEVIAVASDPARLLVLAVP